MNTSFGTFHLATSFVYNIRSSFNEEGSKERKMNIGSKIMKALQLNIRHEFLFQLEKREKNGQTQIEKARASKPSFFCPKKVRISNSCF
ncbi:hypothetical protein EUGRSUZ_H04117 [Eucalyptus grandis]|uniref:Uncharacterized protein n=2 Tax=Eucalyptus grandis TaxID=71139 RepID=A0ACC3JW18_EUCGR|nr:hypothetical protein EUGRSUZ_H04117 [Eucalyptus grandis]